MSWRTASVSAWTMVIASTPTPSASAHSWASTVVVPLPNSAVPTRSVKRPEPAASSDTVAWAW